VEEKIPNKEATAIAATRLTREEEFIVKKGSQTISSYERKENATA